METTASTGRRMTAAVQPFQNAEPPGSGARRRAKRPGLATRLPSSSGSSVAAPSIATATTSIAPSAIERIAWLSTIHRPASDTITVRPEKSTASPEVAIATERASSCDRPAATSSR